jgi:two-component system phosphate regulon response regulator PhoB
MSKETILVVDDEIDILTLVEYNLLKEGYHVHTAETGEKGLQLATREIPDLVVLDLMLPGIDGMEVCRRIKSNEATNSIPIIMLTAKGEDVDIVSGLEVGADDYLTKPFSPKVLIARIRSLIRRNAANETSTPGTLHVHNILIDKNRHEVTIDGVEVLLSATEFAILEFLAKNPGWVFSRNKIIDAVKGQDYPVTDRSVDVQILGLRKKLGTSGDIIETVRGVGYRLRPEG